MSIITVPTSTLPEATLLVLALAASGMTDPEIAKTVGVQPHSITTRISRTLGLLGVESRTAAVAMAYREGWLKPVPTPRTGAALAPRQLEIVRLLLAGLTEPQICTVLDLQRSGLRSHLRRIYRKLGALNRPNLIRIAVDTGLVEVPR